MKKQDFIDHYDQIMKANEQRRLDYNKAVKRCRFRTLLIKIVLLCMTIALVLLLVFNPFHNRAIIARLASPCFMAMSVLLLISNQYPYYPMMIPPPILPIEGFEDEA